MIRHHFATLIGATLWSFSCQADMPHQAPSVVDVTTSGSALEKLDNRDPAFLKAHCSTEFDPQTKREREVLEIVLMKGLQLLEIKVPLAVGVGTHPVAGAVSNEEVALEATVDMAKIRYRGLSRTTYRFSASGYLAIESFPKKQGDHFIAELRSTLMSQNNEAIKLAADIDVVAGALSFDDCRPRS